MKLTTKEKLIKVFRLYNKLKVF